MIKIELEKLCAVISRKAEVKEGKNGQSFLSFSVKLPINGRNNTSKELEISVTADGDKTKAMVYSVGKRVDITGVLTVRKQGGRQFFNCRSERVTLVSSTNDDVLSGTLSFRGKTGKKDIVTQKDKKEEDFKVFSAYSSDKNGDNTEFTWIRFLCFDKNLNLDIVKPSTYVEVSGEAQFDVYNDAISISCVVSAVKPWVLEKK
jgi:hypothetical protein